MSGRSPRKTTIDKGIRLFWLDEAEPEYPGYDFERSATPRIGPEIGNIYPFMHSRAFYEGMTEAGDGRHRKPRPLRLGGKPAFRALVWSGDIDATYEALRSQFAAGLNMGLAGIPWWTTDIGGFDGGDPDAARTGSSSCAGSNMAHSARSCGSTATASRARCRSEPRAAPAVAPARPTRSGATARRPTASARSTSSSASGSSRGSKGCAPRTSGGTPHAPAILRLSRRPAAWDIEDEFIFSGLVVAAPVLYPGLRSREVYLPEGRWRSIHDGEYSRAAGP